MAGAGGGQGPGQVRRDELQRFDHVGRHRQQYEMIGDPRQHVGFSLNDSISLAVTIHGFIETAELEQRP